MSEIINLSSDEPIEEYAETERSKVALAIVGGLEPLRHEFKNSVLTFYFPRQVYLEVIKRLESPELEPLRRYVKTLKGLNAMYLSQREQSRRK